MSKESKELAAQTWDAKRVLSLVINNALIIIMTIAAIVIAVLRQLHCQYHLANCGLSARRSGHRRMYCSDRYGFVRRTRGGPHRLYLRLLAPNGGGLQ